MWSNVIHQAVVIDVKCEEECKRYEHDFFLQTPVTKYFCVHSSKISNIGPDSLCLANRQKLSNHQGQNISVCIHPEGWHARPVSDGVPSERAKCSVTQGKINKGGLYLPAALK